MMTIRPKLLFLLFLLIAVSGCLNSKKPIESHEMAFKNSPDFVAWLNSGFPREVHKVSAMPDTSVGLYSFSDLYYSRQGNAVSTSSRLQSSVRETADIDGEYKDLREIQEGVLRDYFTRNGMKVKKYRSTLTRAILEELRLGDLQPISKPFSIVCYETYSVSLDGVTELAWMTVLCGSDNNNTPGSFLLNQIFLPREAFKEVLLKQDRQFVKEQEIPYW